MSDFTRIIFSTLVIVGGFIAGLIFERIIISWLKSIAKKTKWKIDDIVISSMRHMPLLWFTLLGAYISLYLFLGKEHFPRFFPLAEKIIFVIFALTITIVITKIAVRYIQSYSAEAPALLPSTSIFVNITRAVVLGIGILIILQTLGISITPVITAFGIGGLAVALALQSTLSNLFAGLQIIFAKQLKPGDYIKLESGEEGYVVDITWRNTVLRQLPNNIIIVPNAKMADVIITNYHQPVPEMSVIVQVGVSYDSDLEKVEKVTIDVAKEVLREVPGGVESFEPFIRYHTFDESSINFSVILRVREYVDQYLLKHEFIKRLHKRYQQEGINIPFPIRTVYLKQSTDDSSKVSS